MSALWRRCKRCRRVYRGKPNVPGRGPRMACAYCPGRIKLHGIRKEQTGPMEAAWLLGGLPAAQEVATPGRQYPFALVLEDDE